MDSQGSGVNRFAILIGINAYQERPLKACVGDVKRIESYLSGLVPRPHITILTATKNDTNPEAADVTEERRHLATHENVTAAIDNVDAIAKAGDIVYMHFSGHGTRAVPERKFSNRSTGDLALVLLDEANTQSVKYLWGHELALSLRELVDRKVVVTLVLDCCCSAAVYRNDDPEVRFLPYDPTICSERITEGQSLVENGDDASRAVSMMPNWMVNPNGYAILSACGPHEDAREPKFNDVNRGALSYFLLMALETIGVARKHKDIYDHILAKFKSYEIPQNPVLYGNKLQAFFAPSTSQAIATTVPVIENADGLYLQAGVAHCVGDGDEFLLCPLRSTGLELESQQESIIAHVDNARAFTSSLKLLEPTSTPETGWVARALTRSCLKSFPVRLDNALSNQEEWLKALRERSLIVTTGSTASFNIVLKQANECEIWNEENQKIPNTPTTILSNQADLGYICDFVEHLARFKAVEALSNDKQVGIGSTFRQSFDLHMYQRSTVGQVIHPEGLAEVKDGDQVRLVLKNKGSNDLHMFIYSMSSGWQIENVVRATYHTLPPKDIGNGYSGEFDTGLKFTVPKELKENGYTQCDDMLKVFVTSRPTSFEILELPGLGKTLENSGTGGRREDDKEMSGDWAAFNFRIRTTLGQG